MAQLRFPSTTTGKHCLGSAHDGARAQVACIRNRRVAHLRPQHPFGQIERLPEHDDDFAWVTTIVCGLRVGTGGLEPSQGHPGKRGLLGASEWPTFFPRSFENGHTSPRPLKSLPRGPESLSGALRGLWEGVSETPNCWDEGSNSEAPKGLQNLCTPEPGFAPPVLPLRPQLKQPSWKSLCQMQKTACRAKH